VAPINGRRARKGPAAKANRTAAGRSGSPVAQSGPELIEILWQRIRDSVGRGWAAASGRKRAPATRRKPAAAVGSRAAGKTRGQLYEIARKRGLPGRSRMRKAELARKLGMR
jgi:hypothetical protein